MKFAFDVEKNVNFKLNIKRSVVRRFSLTTMINNSCKNKNNNNYNSNNIGILCGKMRYI